MTTFNDLKLVSALQKALTTQGYERPTPIQAQAIPPLLAGKDVLGCAQTGTGKTAAFCLPVLNHLANRRDTKRGRRKIAALILTPTRELAAQIGENLGGYGQNLPHKHLVIFGGVNENPQKAALRRGVDILVATPGRLLDLHGQGCIDLGAVEFFVLDEADRMLDMGFIHDVKKLLAILPEKRQNLLFSATMPKSIVTLANSFLHDPTLIEIAPQSTTVERIEQQVMFVDRPNKRRLLAQLIKDEQAERSIVFTRTKHGANRLVKQLDKAGIDAAAIHGNKSQSARKKALSDFKSGATPVLVATDIASRGIDVDDVTHVFNYDLPNEPESYVHRIGRTGRAGRDGVAISFCDESEGGYLRDIERTIGMQVPVVLDHPYHEAAAIPPADARPSKKSRSGGGRGKRPRSQRANGSSRPAQKRNRKSASGETKSGMSKPTKRAGKSTAGKTSPNKTSKTGSRKSTAGEKSASGNKNTNNKQRRRRPRRPNKPSKDE